MDLDVGSLELTWVAVCIDAWPYGGPDPDETIPRYTQGICFARDTRKGEHTNHYGYPLPIIPVMETHSLKLVRIDKLATGGREDGLGYDSCAKNVLDHCASSEYVPELMSTSARTDVKPLNILQPEGPSFKVTDESLIEWQNWRFRVGFNPREGATLHDIHYDGRSILYRLSLSEMTVPYGDPRPRSIESTPSTLETAEQVEQPTTWPWDVTVWE